MRHTISRLTLAALLAVGLLVFAAGAAWADPLAEGRAKMAAQEYEGAYHSFFAAFEQHPTHPEVNFLLGRAAFESGRYEEAVMAYERVLMYNQDSGRTRLELARTYMRLGSTEIARRYFLEVLATNPPEAVWQNIQRFLAALDAAEKKHFFTGMFTVGVGHDSNVRTSPVSNIVDTVIGNVTLTGDGATVTGNYLLNTNLVLNHVYRKRPSTPRSWRTTFTNYNAFHEAANDRDLNLYGLSTGPTWRKERLLIRTSLSYNQIDLGFDRYLGILGISGGLTHVVNQNIVLNAEAAIQKKNNHQDGDRDAYNYSFNLGPVFSYGKNRLNLMVGLETERAKVDLNNTYDRLRLLVRYDRALPRDFSFFTAFRFQDTSYTEEAPLFGVTRHDETKTYSAGVSRPLWRSADRSRSLTGQATHSRTVAHSNIDLYDYRKNVSTVAVTLTF